MYNRKREIKHVEHVQTIDHQYIQIIPLFHDWRPISHCIAIGKTLIVHVYDILGDIYLAIHQIFQVSRDSAE